MFIIEPIKREDAKGELKLLYKIIERSMGFVPPHFELFATIDIEGMKEFMQYNQKMMTHEKIDKNLLPYLRLYLAQKNARSYCVMLNTKILASMKVDKNIIENIISNIEKLPFNQKQKSLLSKVIKALEYPKNFSKDDLLELQNLGFTDKDFLDLLGYATNFVSKSKIVEVYLKKPMVL